MNYDNFLKLIRTKNEQDELLNLIEDLTENLYKKKADKPLSPFQTLLKNEIIKILQSQNIYENKLKTEKFFKALLKSVKELPVLKLTIAIEPDQHLIDSIKLWADKNKMNGTIFEFIVDPKILGGIIIVNPNGTYSDYSLLRRIDELFTNQKQYISKLL